MCKQVEQVNSPVSPLNYRSPLQRGSYRVDTGFQPVLKPECPVCQETMEEIVAYVTECCGAEMEEGVHQCPLCGAQNPIVVKSDPNFVCERCGFKET